MKKWPGGSAQTFEKARFGEGNPSISFAGIWPGFAGLGSNLARFGSSLDFTLGPRGVLYDYHGYAVYTY
jgi:hypothetical protein